MEPKSPPFLKGDLGGFSRQMRVSYSASRCSANIPRLPAAQLEGCCALKVLPRKDKFALSMIMEEQVEQSKKACRELVHNILKNQAMWEVRTQTDIH
jgi:hypothetical protein